MKNKFREPELFVNDAHGIYMGKFAWEQLNERYQKQARKVLSDEVITDLSNVESEFYCDACDSLTNVIFVTETGQKWVLSYADGGIWAIPFCFKGKKLGEFFGN